MAIFSHAFKGTKIEGMRELEQSIKRLGAVPQRFVTKAARSGANIALKAARKRAPEDTGALKKGIVLKGEKNRVKGKKVYDVMMDPTMNDVFQKQTVTGLRRVRKGKEVEYGAGGYYYPASQEFGFVARNGRYIPGFHFLKDSLTDNAGQIEKKVVDVLSKEVDKALKG